MTQQQTEIGRIIVGAVYVASFTGLRYHVVAIGQDWPSGQRKSFHVGLNGWDEGNYHSCSLATFAREFTRVIPTEPVPELPSPVLPPAPPHPLAWYRAIAQATANQYCETCLLITEPQPAPVSGTVPQGPYCVLASAAEPYEREATQERFEPE